MIDKFITMMLLIASTEIFILDFYFYFINVYSFLCILLYDHIPVKVVEI